MSEITELHTPHDQQKAIVDQFLSILKNLDDSEENDSPQMSSSSSDCEQHNIDNIPNMFMHSQSMPQSLPLNNRHLAKYLSKSSSRIDQDQKVDDSIEKRKLIELYNQMKLDPLNFHSMETFSKFIRYRLNLKQDPVSQILTNPKVQYWIDRNKIHGFVYQTVPKPQLQLQNDNNSMPRKMPPPVRCDLCKFYGHLSHTCTVKELAFKLNNVVLRNGACKCHICGLIGHPAETGLCPYIVCSFCHQNGHWNFMCPNKDKISRTLCHRCQRYGHSASACPDQWRQFDRISTFEQTSYREHDNNKPVYCYQCAQKGHYGYNCPDFHRKFFIRDYHHLDNYPVYFFASASPFVKYPVTLTENDKQIIASIVDNPIDMRYAGLFDEDDDELDTLAELERFQQKATNLSKTDNINDSNIKNDEFVNSTIFNESHKNIPLKEYIRKWSNWVIDFHWVFTLKYFIDSLPTYKLHYFIKNYPSLDNFILHWMWWSYTLSRDLERCSKDPFRAAGTMPWLILDNKLQISNLNKSHQEQLKMYRKFQTKLKSNGVVNPELANFNNEIAQKEKRLRNLIKLSQQASKFYQYSEHTIKTINSLLFPNENSKSGSNKNSSKNLLQNLKGDHDDSLNSNRTRENSISHDDFDDESPNESDRFQTDSSDTDTIINSDYLISEPQLHKHKHRRLMRSKSCNAIFYHGTTNEATHLVTTLPQHQNYYDNHQLLHDIKSKSTSNSPYIMPKLTLYKTSKELDKKVKQKLDEFESKQLEQGPVISKELKLDYVHDIHHFQTDELTNALLNRLDSYGTFQSEAELNPLISNETKAVASEDDNNEEDEQDKTIVFELGCCDGEDDVDVENNRTNNTSSSSTSDECPVGMTETEKFAAKIDNEIDEIELGRKEEVNANEELNCGLDGKFSQKTENILNIDDFKNDFFKTKIDDLNSNQTIIVNSLTADHTQPSLTENKTSTNHIFAKLFAPLTTNNNDKNNNNINNDNLKQTILNEQTDTNQGENSLNSILRFLDQKTSKLDETDQPNILKERLRVESTNLIKLLLKIDNPTPTTLSPLQPSISGLVESTAESTLQIPARETVCTELENKSDTIAEKNVNLTDNNKVVTKTENLSIQKMNQSSLNSLLKPSTVPLNTSSSSNKSFTYNNNRQRVDLSKQNRNSYQQNYLNDSYKKHIQHVHSNNSNSNSTYHNNNHHYQANNRYYNESQYNDRNNDYYPQNYYNNENSYQNNNRKQYDTLTQNNYKNNRYNRQNKENKNQYYKKQFDVLSQTAPSSFKNLKTHESTLSTTTSNQNILKNTNNESNRILNDFSNTLSIITQPQPQQHQQQQNLLTANNPSMFSSSSNSTSSSSSSSSTSASTKLSSISPASTSLNFLAKTTVNVNNNSNSYASSYSTNNNNIKPNYQQNENSRLNNKVSIKPLNNNSGNNSKYSNYKRY